MWQAAVAARKRELAPIRVLPLPLALGTILSIFVIEFVPLLLHALREFGILALHAVTDILPQCSVLRRNDAELQHATLPNQCAFLLVAASHLLRFPNCFV